MYIKKIDDGNLLASSMHYLSVGAVFKNEGNIIVEWIKHYLYHGVDHFYLINDNSDDDSVAKIQPYIDQGLITLYHSQEPSYLGRQRNVYNKFILPHLQQKDTQWLLMIDLDEYIWSPLDIRIDNVLRVYCSTIGQLQMYTFIYGSNGHQKQPESLVQYFTKRQKESIPCYKYFVNSNFEFTSLNVHHADFAEEKYKTDASVFMIVNTDYLMANHYCCQSLEFWRDVKCTRGDGDAFWKRTMNDFHDLDRNEVEDLRLWEQNKDIK